MAQREIGPYIIGRTLGEGGFSKVKLGQHKETGEFVALKLLKSNAMDKNALKQVEGEIRAMAAVKHVNVLGLKDFNYAAEYPKKNGKKVTMMLVVLECARGGELFEFLSATGPFEETIARTYFHQLIEGVGYCHSKNVVHRDLKPENLLFDEGFNLKLADFGFSKVVDATNTMYTQCGTPGYMAPEMFERQGYDAKKVDIWACGVILFIMIAGFPPFQKPAISDWWFHKLKNNKHELFWRAHSRTVYFSDSLKDLINKTLCPDPNTRISLEDMKKHTWFTSEIVSDAAVRDHLQGRKNKIDQTKVREEMIKNAKQHGMAQGQSLSGAMATVRALGAEDDSLLPPTMEFFAHGIEASMGAKGASMGDMGDMEGMGGMDMGGMSMGSSEEKKDEAEVLDAADLGNFTQFESEVDATALFERLQGWVQKLDKDFSVKSSFKLKAKIMTDNGVVALRAQVYRKASSDRHVVVVSRMDGDGMQYRALYAQLRELMNDWVAK